jgi:hypothetical protein
MMSQPKNLASRRKPRGGHKNLQMRMMEYLTSAEYEPIPTLSSADEHEAEIRYRRRKYNRRASRFEAPDKLEYPPEL